MSRILSEIGREVVETSRETGGRGIVAQLFPYILEASKRLSARAISREFQKRDVKISQVSISKALRDPDRHFEAHFDYVEPAARVIDQKLGFSAKSLLTIMDSFQEAQALYQSGEYLTDDEQLLRDAFTILSDDWWSLGEDFRDRCLEHGELADEDEPDAGIELEPNES